MLYWCDCILTRKCFLPDSLLAFLLESFLSVVSSVPVSLCGIKLEKYSRKGGELKWKKGKKKVERKGHFISKSWGSLGVQMATRVGIRKRLVLQMRGPQAVFSNRTFCSYGIILFLTCLGLLNIWIWLVWLQNARFHYILINLNLNSYIWLVATLLDSTAPEKLGYMRIWWKEE